MKQNGNKRPSQGPLYTGPWDLEALQQSPAIEWGAEVDYPGYTLKQLYYTGECYRGQPTRVFAYYAVPKGIAGKAPAIVLLHGGGGRAFADWAGQWAERGYVAIAMDLYGNGPDGERMADGGPAQGVFEIFKVPLTDMWEYHAVSNVILAVTVIAAQPEVDETTIGMMGISWGGYVADIATSFDQRLAYVMSVYSAGSFATGSCWMAELEKLGASGLQAWEEQFEIMSYMGQSTIPTFRATGTKDNCFYLHNWQQTYEAAKGERTLRLANGWQHGYTVPWEAQEFFTYADSRARGGTPLAAITALRIADNEAGASYSSSSQIKRVNFVYSSDTASWPDRLWHEQEAKHDANRRAFSSHLPPGVTAYFFTLEDDRGNVVSSDLVIL
ncbi:alpha/beta hydrolase family protein [Paenibacillus eucommiae]|uniref:Poly(3-hydroxybutyrate) depolymerase n=1 Tax=Paenibacillus eucommiae TaxID=1355755 RepID=A0ABS4ILT0_9BACL|nr:acetylxylan esterase [Paenibacillus eucommiae]MBP1988475.1 poly(3-hydroxybutyrate) depolymerase [Paenibacillus eucommiae]